MDDEQLAFSGREGPGCRQERNVLAPCHAFSGGSEWVASAGGEMAPPVDSPSSIVESRKPSVGNIDDNVASAQSDLIDLVPHLVWTSDVEGRVTFANARWREFADKLPVGLPWIDMLHADEQAAATAGWHAQSASGQTYEGPHRLGGGGRWILVRIVAMLGHVGAPMGWCGTFTDIHEIKSSEAMLELQERELSHRMQNIFAVVESLLSLSARSQPDAAEFARATSARIRSLARAQDYIRPQRGEMGVTTLHGLLDILLAPYQQGDACHPTVEIAGTDHPIGSSSATLLAMVMHELAINAAIYGALSRAAGRVSITTGLDAGQLNLTWCERGGPAVSEPTTGHGFGTMLTDRALRLPLGAQVERIWCSTGLIMKISLPCERLTN